MICLAVFQCPPLKNNVYILHKKGEKVALLVDASEPTSEMLEYLMINSLAISAILLTHTHFDHVTGLEKILEMATTDVEIYAHHKGAPHLCEGVVNPVGWPYHGDLPCIADQQIKWVDEGDSLDVYGLSIDVTYTPGHSYCGVVFLVNKKLCFTGDTVFYHTVGRTDIAGANQADLQTSLVKIKATISPEVLVLPGHGRYGMSLGRALK